MNRIRGFTLIEIVVVIVLIGILSAVALPRFYNFTTEAADAATEGAAGAFASSVGMANAACIAQGRPASVTVEGGSISVDRRSCLPNAGGGALTADGCSQLMSSLLSSNSVQPGTDYTVYAGASGSVAGAVGGTADTCIYVNNDSEGNGSPEAGDTFSAFTYNRTNGKVDIYKSVSIAEAAPAQQAPAPGNGG